MKKNIGWIAALVLLVALIAGASVLYNRLGDSYAMEQLTTQPSAQPHEASSPAEQTEPEETAPIAPDFTVVDGEGNEVRLSDFFGKPIVLNFWASWCGPCKMEMPDFEEKYLLLKDEVIFLMVNMTDGSRETLETAKAFIDASGYTFPVFYDVNYEAAYGYGVTSLPTTYFIAPDGTLIAYGMGAMSADTLQRGIDMIYPAK